MLLTNMLEFLLIGHICWTNPIDVDSCQQIIIRDAISYPDCTIKFTSRVTREKAKIEKKGLSVTSIDGYCFQLEEGVDKFMHLSYDIK